MMRSNHLKALILSLTLVGWAMIGSAQTTLVPITQEWLYTNIKTNLGTAWRNVGYNDAIPPWEATPGIAMFGFETTPLEYPLPFNTPLNLKDPGATDATTTFYFRTHFNFTGPTFGAVLTSSNLVDDGVAYYINGTPVGTLRVPANPGYLTVATAGPTVEGEWDVLELSPSSLVQGDNVLAAEVHQILTTSSDITFGMNLHFAPGAAIVITTQPQSHLVVIGTPLLLNVVNSGTQPRYQWFKDTTRLTGATASSYTNTAPQASSSGNYYVVITNVFGAVTSSIANIVVLPDTFGPHLVDAVRSLSNQVTVTFSESLLATPAKDLANYQITSGTTVLTITNITQSLKTVKILTKEVLAITADWNYILTASNIRDATANTNIMAPNSQIAISYSVITNLFGWDQQWRYNENEVDNALGTEWYATSYPGDDPTKPPFHWSEGFGVFAFDQSLGFRPCSPVNQLLSFGANTTYFRSSFILTTNYPAGTSLVISNMVDDGAIFYLNGKELLRTRMPAGNVTYATAGSGIGDATCVSSTAVVTNLIKGKNVFAAEVHQAADLENDVSFGVALSLATPIKGVLPVDAPPRLKLTRLSPTQISLSWTTGHGFALEGAKDPKGIWFEVANMNTNTVINTTNSFQLYRLHKAD